MKIVVNALSARRGGIVTYTRNLMQTFRNRNVDAVFALPVDSEIPEEISTIRFPVTGMSPLSRAIWEQTFWRWVVKCQKPDILYSSANFGLIVSPIPQVLLVREGGLFDPFYLTNVAPSLGVGALFERVLRRKLILASARSSDMILTPTNAMNELLTTWSREISGKLETNLYGTLLNHFRRRAEHRPWKKDGVIRLLTVSAYYAHKQPGLVAEAVRILNEQGISAHLSLTLDLDQIENTPGSAKDIFLIRKGVERDQVTLLGQVKYEDLPMLYANHDVFVSASISETFGHPMIEAMASNTLIVAADTPVHREVCMGAAAYFSPLSEQSLVEKLTDLDRNEYRRDEMRKLGQAYSAEQYGWDLHVDRLLGHFEYLLASKK